MKAPMVPLFLLPLVLETSVGVRTQGRKPDESTVRSLDEKERTAVLKRDVPNLDRLWSNQFTVNAPNNTLVVGKAGVLELMKRGVIHYSTFGGSANCTR